MRVGLLPEAAVGEASRFRVELYACLTGRDDELFELADAVLCAPGAVHSAVELTLLPEHRRGHGAMYDVLRALLVPVRHPGRRDFLAVSTGVLTGVAQHWTAIEQERAPDIRLQVLVPELANPTQQAADATFALRKAIDRTELDARRHTAKEASIAFIAAAATLLSPNNP